MVEAQRSVLPRQRSWKALGQESPFGVQGLGFLSGSGIRVYIGFRD